MDKLHSGSLVRESMLFQDLYHNHRDQMYRAMAFIAQRGGPPPPGDTVVVLTVHRVRSKNWLYSQKNPSEHLDAYEQFVHSWRPIFQEK